MQQNQGLHFDVLIVGGGPAGLACAIKLAQLNRSISICVLDKGSQIGTHILSGCVLNPIALNQLIPNWKEQNTPIKTRVQTERFYWLTQKNRWRMPVPPQMHNHGNYIISLSKLCVWLAEYAQSLGINIFPGYAAQSAIFDENEVCIGVKTGEMGIRKDFSKNDQYQPGVEIYGKQVVLAEGAKGSLTEDIIKKFNLNHNAQPQNYAIGVKEVWQTNNSPHYADGLCIHTLGFPLDNRTYGGGFIYHYEKKIAVGIVLGLDFENPYLDSHGCLQTFKTHPTIAHMLSGSTCIAYGARALNEGGFQAIPKLTFPGGVIIGCAGGLLNIAQLKGTHNAMESGIMAAEAIHQHLRQKTSMSAYQSNMEQSRIWRELSSVRNIRPGFYRGRIFGLCNAVFETITMGLSPWTLKLRADYKTLKPKKNYTKPIWPKPDGVLTFAKTDSIRLTGTNHTEDQPCHLIIKDPSITMTKNYNVYGGPEQYYCPANVYEYVTIDNKLQLQINAQNCIHCKTCSIKDPNENIQWKPPQGGEGPLYSET